MAGTAWLDAGVAAAAINATLLGSVTYGYATYEARALRHAPCATLYAAPPPCAPNMRPRHAPPPPSATLCGMRILSQAQSPDPESRPRVPTQSPDP